ncbi:S26 family signal peptidase [Actinocatenispora thailandica]|uniref:S26 family signal peptidase n=1 Tax=Actinocatenispora thailandica TaxID=227318 RepID=UPI001EF19C27|nr:S26 family signal peptidase [Actinocatenispora thailandica]
MRSVAVLVGGVVAVGAVAAALVAARRQLVAVAVSGSSMAPALDPGDRVLVRRRRPEAVRVGQIVVVEGPPNPDVPDWSGLPAFDGRLDGRHWFIKRVAALPGDPVPATVRAAVAEPAAPVPPGCLVLLGDNDRSVDSRSLGYFPAERLLGTVVRELGRAR